MVCICITVSVRCYLCPGYCALYMCFKCPCYLYLLVFTTYSYKLYYLLILWLMGSILAERLKQIMLLHLEHHCILCCIIMEFVYISYVYFYICIYVYFCLIAIKNFLTPKKYILGRWFSTLGMSTVYRNQNVYV